MINKLNNFTLYFLDDIITYYALNNIIKQILNIYYSHG